MTKKNLTFFGLLALFAASCSNDEMSEIPTIKQDAIVVTAGLNANTRVSFSQGDNVTHAFWEENDQITLYAASQGGLDYQVNSISEDGSTATFAPVGDALRNTDETIYATYPATVIKEGIATLPTTDVWTDEKPLPFAYAISQVEDGSVNLSFSHLFAYLKLTLNAETTTNEVTSLWMKTSSSEPLAIKEGAYDIANDKLNLVESSNNIYFKLQEPFIAAKAIEKSLYIPILPQPAGEIITLSILSEHEAGCDTLLTIHKETPSTGFLAGHAYTYSPKAIMEGNVVTITTAGTLSTLIPDAIKDTITSLKIIGSLNGNDIRFLREKLGGMESLTHETINNTDQVLALEPAYSDYYISSLDLSEASIVSSNSYYVSIAGELYFTEDNVIGNGMFAMCPKLVSIILPNTVHKIGELAFSCSENLEKVTLPKKQLDIMGPIFNGCHSLCSVNIPKEMTYIPDFSFAYCQAPLEIPSTVVDIGRYAFNNSNVSSAYLENVKKIGDSAFNGSKIENLTVLASFQESGTKTFANCSSLASVSFLPGSKAIGYSMFSECGFTIFDKTNIGHHSHSSSNRRYKEIHFDLPEGITTIESYAFYRCCSLDSITLPSTLDSIGNNAFEECCHLQYIRLPQNLKYIASSTFRNAQNLREITIPEGVVEIGDLAFFGCLYMKSITLPSTLKKIGYNAFNLTGSATMYRAHINTVRFLSKEVPDGCVDGMFDDEYLTIYVPKGSKDLYAAVFTSSNYTIIEE